MFRNGGMWLELGDKRGRDSSRGLLFLEPFNSSSFFLDLTHVCCVYCAPSLNDQRSHMKMRVAEELFYCGYRGWLHHWSRSFMLVCVILGFDLWVWLFLVPVSVYLRLSVDVLMSHYKIKCNYVTLNPTYMQ